jgi:mRNA-degrading endonuclease toxin of MazEF toxin-antitoxin module
MIRPGEIYLADFEEMEPHPVVVVSREELNRGNWVAAVLITSKRFEERSKQPHCVPFRAGQFGLSKDCVAQGESLFFHPARGVGRPPRDARC